MAVLDVALALEIVSAFDSCIERQNSSKTRNTTSKLVHEIAFFFAKNGGFMNNK